MLQLHKEGSIHKKKSEKIKARAVIEQIEKHNKEFQQIVADQRA